MNHYGEKGFYFLDPDCVNGFSPKFNGFYVGPIPTHKNILVKIGPVLFSQFCLHTNTHTHKQTNSSDYIISQKNLLLL